MKAYVYESSGLEGVPCRTIHRNTALKTAVDPNAQVSTNPGAALFEISESVRSKGLRPRHVVLGRISSSTGFLLGSPKKVAIATQARWEEISPGDQFTVNNTVYKLIRKVAEEVGV
jgi:hypothetical protein